MIHPPRPGTVVGQPLPLAFRDSGPEVDVGRGVGVRLDGAGPAAETRQVLIGLTHRCLAVANIICGSLRQDLRIVVGHVVQVGSSFRARTARQDHRRGTPRRARPATDRATEPRPTY